jgi:hypothetical protein
VFVFNCTVDVKMLLYGELRVLGEEARHVLPGGVPMHSGLSMNMIGVPLISGKRRLKTISDVANSPSASVVNVWSPLSVAVKVTFTVVVEGLTISKSPVPPKSPPSPPWPVDVA